MKSLLILFSLFFSSALFAASYPANTDIGQTDDLCWQLGKERGRTTNLTPVGPVLVNQPEAPGSSEAGVTRVREDSSWEFGATLCDQPVLIENHFDMGQPVGAHGTMLRYFNAYGMTLYGLYRGFYFDAAGADSAAQLVDLDPWPGDNLEVNNYAGMSSIECAGRSWWHYGTPPNVDWSASGTRCSDYAAFDHLSLTGVFGFTKFSGELMLQISDQSSTGLAIYDMSNRAQPRLLADYNPQIPQTGGGTIGLGGYWADVWGESKVVWSAEPSEGVINGVPVRNNSAITIVDYSNPEDPQLTCFVEFTEARSVHGSRNMYVAFQDGYAYVDQFRVDIAACESRFAYDNTNDTITDPIDDADYAAVVHEFPDFVNRGDCSQYARPIGQLVICGGIDNLATEQIVTLDNVATLSQNDVVNRTSDGTIVFIHHVIAGTNEAVIQNFAGTLTAVGDTFDHNGTTLTVNATVIDDRVNEQGMTAFVQWDEPDTAAPFVAGHRPLDGQTNFPVNGHINFSIPSTLRSETVTAAIESNQIRVFETVSGTDLTFDYQYSHTGNHVIDATLAVDTQYTVQVAGIQDFMGNEIASYSWSFTTGNAPVTRGQNVFDLLGGVTEPPSFTGTPYYPNKSGQLAGNPAVANSNVWVVNPDNDTVTIIAQSVGAAPSYTLSTNVVREIAGDALEKPTSVARVGTEYAVSWADSDTVTLYNAAGDLVHTYTLAYGDKPVSVIADGDTLYVALYGAEQILKIDNATRAIVGVTTINAGFIGLAGNELIPATPKAMALSEDGSRLLVTRQISSRDKGLVYDIATGDMTLTRTIDVNRVRVADDIDHGSGILNNLNSIVISPDGTRALITAFKQNTGRGTGPTSNGQALDDDNTIRAAVATIDLVNSVDLNSDPLTVAGTADLDNSADPVAITYTPDGNSSMIALRGNNRVLVTQSEGGNGVTTYATGFAPSDIFTTLRHAFVKNLNDRTVDVIEIAGWMHDNRTNPPIETVSTVASETFTAEVLAGKRSFFHSTIPAMGPEGYMTCASCHFDGGDDGQVFDFTQMGEGLRNTISLNGKSGTRFGNPHWTLNFDELQDFECQIENLNRGEGLVPGFDTCPDGTDPLTLTTTGLSTALDNLAAYMSSLGLDTVSRSADRNTDGTQKDAATVGETLFTNSGCAACHSGDATTDGLSHDVGTGGTFKTPLLIDLAETAPYFHDGSALSLKNIFDVGQHQTDTTSLSELEKAQLIAYLLSRDRSNFVANEE